MNVTREFRKSDIKRSVSMALYGPINVHIQRITKLGYLIVYQYEKNMNKKKIFFLQKLLLLPVCLMVYISRRHGTRSSGLQTTERLFVNRNIFLYCRYC